jgi:palmitoyltransferase
VNLNEIVKMKKLCYHHQSKLEFFCESCDEAICKQCQIIGPHNTNYHRIIPIREAFNKKFYQLSKMKPILMNKLGELNYYNNRVNDLTEKVNKEKNILIRDIRSQYSVLSEKIKDVEGKRNSILSFEAWQLQIDNNNIQGINCYISDVQVKKVL